MNNFNNLKPYEVLCWFYEICKIPHGSGNTEAIADFIVNFAENRGYKYVKDGANNVIIYANGTEGYENSKPIILQGHTDMVCEKEIHCNIDMETEPIKLGTDGEFLWAEGTTLGADNGIAVAYMLAVLDNKEIPHPPLECLFTSDEEIGMVGARSLDVNNLNTNLLINIDSEEEGVLTVSCAGGVRANCHIPIEKDNFTGTGYKIVIKGLRGGHSGIEINQHRINAIKLMSEMLHGIHRKTGFRMANIKGGNKDNVIPTSCECNICVEDINSQKFLQVAESVAKGLKVSKQITEPNIDITIEKVDTPLECLTTASTEKILFALLQAPDGVCTMSPDIPDMVQTSLNLGVLTTEKDNIYMRFFVRSNAATGKQALVLKLQSFFEYLDGTIEFRNDYPAWEYNHNSKLRDMMVETFNDLYGYQPQVTALHAGLECGILSGKISNMDAVSFGPDMYNVHTPQEKVSIPSVERCWNYLKAVLKNCK